MTSRAYRSLAAILSILVLSGAPTHAAPVAISEVIQVLGSYQNSPELRLRSASQRSTSLVDEAGAPPDTLLAGVAVSADQPAGIDIVDQGDVEGTICNCGEITVPGGGFPKWPLLFLAAIPFFFIDGCDHCETPTPPTTPTPPGTPEIPEPASLLLFGTGLAAFGAGLRRRYAKGKLASQMQTREEG